MIDEQDMKYAGTPGIGWTLLMFPGAGCASGPKNDMHHMTVSIVSFQIIGIVLVWLLKLSTMDLLSNLQD